MNQPLPEQRVATTENFSGSSPEHVANSQNIPTRYAQHFFHLPNNNQSSMLNVLEYLENAIEATSPDFSPFENAAKGFIFSLDYDGTLAPAGMPHSTTKPVPGVMKGLRRLLDVGAEVWLTSGKDVQGLRELIGIEGVKYAGLFGLEYDDGSGVRYHPSVIESHHDAISSVCQILQNQFDPSKFPGIEIEQQGSLMSVDDQKKSFQRMLVTTLVWKGCDDSFDHQHAIETVRALAAEHGLEVNVGHGYANVVPFFPGKGEAVRKIVDWTEPSPLDLEPIKRRTLVSIGDEAPDVAAFVAAQAMKDEGRLASYVNLGVSQPIYDKVVKDVYQYRNGRDIPPVSERRKVFLETDVHDIDPAIDVVAPDGTLTTNRMLLGGPKAVAQFLIEAGNRLGEPFIAAPKQSTRITGEPFALGGFDR